MKSMLFAVLLLAVSAHAKPLAEASYAEGYAYTPIGNGYLITPPAVVPSSQYHAQSELGDYSYGYNNPTSAKVESKTLDGVTRGSYSYVDANGILQTTNYISDDIFGFRVAATNLPVAPVPEAAPVVEAKEIEIKAVPATVAEPVVTAVAAEPVVTAAVPEPAAVGAPRIIAPTVAYSYIPYATNYGYTLPYQPPVVATQHTVAASPQVIAAVAAPKPVSLPARAIVQPVPVPATVPVAVAPAAPIKTQFHVQDEFGQYQFGYSEPSANRVETKLADGAVTGSYNYVDADGLIQTVQYVADQLGFRVAGTNLPVGPQLPEVAPLAPIPETAEVLAARVEHAKAVAAIKAGDVPAVPVVPEVPVLVGPEPMQEAADVVAAREEHAKAVVAAKEAIENYVPVLPVAPVVAPEVVAELPDIDLEPVAAKAEKFITPTAPIVVAPAPVQPNAVAPVAIASSYIPYASTYNYATPVTAFQAPPVAVPASPIKSQFHVQDEFGQYQFGYSEPTANKVETRLADGTVTGSYNYIDANGEIQTVHYVADQFGFRVAGTNLPVAPEAPAVDAPTVDVEPVVAPVVSVPAEPKVVIAPPAVVPAPVEEPVVEVVKVAEPAVDLRTIDDLVPEAVAINTVVPQSVVVAPQVVYAQQPIAAPQVVYTPVQKVLPSVQHHAQDEFGRYAYGYTNEDSAKFETKSADGVVRGSYSYIDANGESQRVDYISDALGFRVAATNLPVAPAVPAAE